MGQGNSVQQVDNEIEAEVEFAVGIEPRMQDTPHTAYKDIVEVGSKQQARSNEDQLEVADFLWANVADIACLPLPPQLS